MSKHLIIGNGEIYAEPVSKAVGGGQKTMPRDYPDAKRRIIAALESLTEEIESKDEVFLEQKIICIRLEPKFEAKSYVPYSVVHAMGNGEAELVGGRKYTIHEDEEDIYAKLYFVRTTDNGIRELRENLLSGARDKIDQWKQQIQSINTINLLKPEEKAMGFDNKWTSGTVEFVLHPLPDNTEKELCEFFSKSGISRENARVKTYEDGITFVSADCSVDNLRRIETYNPLRAAHPLGVIALSPIRSIAGSSCPSVYKTAQKPSIHIGMFDGGVDDTHPLLKGYVNSIEGTPEPELNSLVMHGTGVCSAILYGSLSGKCGTDILDAPCVSINSYRVLPLADKKDYDLYEVIDLIENVVPFATDTKLYNLSMGPDGAIIDDSISRFTYALDKLSYEVPQNATNPLFVVAVGNDGDLPPSFNRIQSPSDIVNGLGVGAYTFNHCGKKIPAQYSCIGPGREGAKTKPDIIDFGGSFDHPFIIPSLDHYSLSGTAGTSFSAPMVTGKIGKLMAMSNSVSPHLGRALLIHNAIVDEAVSKDTQGFGFCTDAISDVLECTDNQVTIMYSGVISPSQYLQLPVFAPRINEMRGTTQISWTIATVVPPYSNDPDAYTNNCIEDVFSPHSMLYSFTKRGAPSHKINLLDASKIPLVKDLIERGYKQSSAPVSHPAKASWDEKDLRAKDMKWDTVIHKKVSMRNSSLFNPSLTLHALGRNGAENNDIRYFVVVTISAPNYQGRLYDSILQTYQSLSPIEVRNLSRLRV